LPVGTRDSSTINLGGPASTRHTTVV